MQELSKDRSLKIIEIRRGSVTVILEGSSDGFEELESRFANGQLFKAGGMRVRAIRPEPSDSAITPLWLPVFRPRVIPPAKPLSAAEEARLALQAKESAELARASFEVIYGAYASTISRLARFFTRDDADAEDVALLVWERFWRYLPKIDPARGSMLVLLRNFLRSATTENYRLRRELDLQFEPDALTEDTPEERIVRVEKRAELLSVFEETLEEVLVHGGPPHERIVFGFNRLLQWLPSEMTWIFSNLTLGDLERRLEATYGEETGSSLGTAETFRRLRLDLQQTNGAFLRRRQPPSSASLLHQIAASTQLREYFIGETQEAHQREISNWVQQVRRRVLHRLSGQQKSEESNES